MNQGPAGLQPDALPLSYIPVFTVSARVEMKFSYQQVRCFLVALSVKKGECKMFLSEMGFEPMPSNEDQNALAYSISWSKVYTLSLAP